MSIRSSRIKTRTVHIRELCSPEKVKQNVQLLNDASLSYTTGRTGASYFKTNPKIQHSNNDRNPIKVIADRTSTFSFLPRRSLNPRFPMNKARP
ncbi:hypothetical protein AVEN_178938-1 [Araneus ventricosus]|uniref:Uncharacterized protein n=1 Tax=Araneus ventricosus TaxID=182803 RepID=A0A4Y2IW95_ARAVE|nr:hypothetical protein AVEN_178938-1 [Araneus ventricosus]